MSGRLFYFMGPSGVGKDTILNALRRSAGERFLFARRVITRPVEEDAEQHLPVSEAEFLRREQAGEFLFVWRSHGFCYGIPQQCTADLAAGRDVVVNGSRGYLNTARQLCPQLVPVLVTASPQTVLARLRHRGRESEEEIAARFARLQDFSLQCKGFDDLIVVENDGSVEEAVAGFLGRTGRGESLRNP